jgi:hypothetical protein
VFMGANDYWLEINKYKDREHYENVKNCVDLDPEIEVLWNELCSIVEKEKIITRKYYQAL